MRRRSSRVLLFGITGSLGMLLLGGTTVHADTTTQSATDRNLDIGPGSGTVAQFDPSLGTLTSVSYTLQARVTLQFCAENRSTGTSVTENTTGNGNLSLTMNATTATAADSFDETPTVAAADEVAQCTDGLDSATDTYLTPVTGADVYYFETSNTATASGTVTDPALLTAWVGSGTVPYTWDGSSLGRSSQPTAWNTAFISFADVDVTVEYTYTPPPATTTSTTTTTLAPTTVPNTVAEVTTTTGAPVTTVATTPPTTPPGGLPSTGSDTGPMLWIATALVAGGFAAWRIGNQRRRTSADG